MTRSLGLRLLGSSAPVRGWPQARRNCVFRPRLVSGEMELRILSRAGLMEKELHLPSDVGLERDRTASLTQSWPRARRNSISHPRLISDETEHHLCVRKNLEISIFHRASLIYSPRRDGPVGPRVRVDDDERELVATAHPVALRQLRGHLPCRQRHYLL